jgi:hypothetical protein
MTRPPSDWPLWLAFVGLFCLVVLVVLIAMSHP